MSGFFNTMATQLLTPFAEFSALAAGGLANAALPTEQLMPRARAAARALAGKPAQALQATKKLMREHARIQGVMASEGREFARRLMSVEAQAIFQAFLARRPPGR